MSVPSSAGKALAARVTDALNKAQVNISANTPATRPSRALSVSNCLTMRSRLAPRDRRVRSSFWRDLARAICRLATLAQATTSTIPAATIMSRIVSCSPGMSFRGRGNGEPGHTSTVAGLANSE